LDEGRRRAFLARNGIFAADRWNLLRSASSQDHIATFPRNKERSMADYPRSDYLDVMDSELTESEAEALAGNECQTRLREFIAALKMQRPISSEKAAILLKHIVKNQMADDANLIAGQMRLDHWELGLANGDNPVVLAERACAYLNSAEGAALYDCFSKIFARSRERMF
jgi:hypothetical protein